MADSQPSAGVIGWMDLTVPQATAVRDFYAAVVGWEHASVDMGDYSDYTMLPPTGDQPVAGICHARGANAGLPAQWLIYVIVENLDASLRACTQHGGQVVFGPRKTGDGQFCVIRDPAGAVAALYEQHADGGDGAANG